MAELEATPPPRPKRRFVSSTVAIVGTVVVAVLLVALISAWQLGQQPNGANPGPTGGVAGVTSPPNPTAIAPANIAPAMPSPTPSP